MLKTRPMVRRTLIVASLATIAAAGTAATRIGSLSAKPATPASTTKEPSNEWLKGLKAKHKQFFDNPSPNGGIALAHMMLYFDTYNKAFNVKDSDINAVLTFYGATTFYGLNDAAWAKYQIGEFLDTKDATGQFATANPWRAAPVVLGAPMPPASLESLHKRGATLILCNNALTIFSGMLAQKRGLDAKVVYEDLKANILPEVDLVPGMVIAVEQAQRAGLTYHRQ
ncbi:MAG TPA: hypothetical protein VJO33_04305 [Gemmatimonadaceae bacterium]|nr:hypothetical protein [Gemmatimonadaceae bacterium]